jgi:L-alanine-DL-glutamate epimerase-like enolase superfamily enzyme
VRLTSVEVIPYALPFKEPYVTARGALTQREMVLLRLRTDEGFEGLGEAVPLSLRGGATLSQVVGELEEVDASEALHELVRHGSYEVSSIPEIDPRLSLSAPAACAVLGAVVDLYGRLLHAEGSKAETLPRDPVACNATLVSGPPAAVAENALAWAAEGFSTFKLKLGGGEDVAQVRAVREALGPGAAIRVDANAAWPLTTATRLLGELEPYDIELVEQPVATIEESAELARLTSIPLCGDESIESREDARRAVAAGAFAVTGIKASKVGGFFAGMEIGEEIPAYVSSALDGPVGIAHGASLATALDPIDYLPPRAEYAHGLATQRLFASTVAAVECELRDGRLHPPPGPGLGVVIDEDALRAHRL